MFQKLSLAEEGEEETQIIGYGTHFGPESSPTTIGDSLSLPDVNMSCVEEGNFATEEAQVQSGTCVDVKMPDPPMEDVIEMAKEDFEVLEVREEEISYMEVRIF